MLNSSYSRTLQGFDLKVCGLGLEFESCGLELGSCGLELDLGT